MDLIMNKEEQTEKEKTVYHYILIRKDLPASVQMVNAVHAAGESIIDAPIPSTTRAVLLGVDNEEMLLSYFEKLKTKNIHYVLIREPDEPYNGAAMAIGIAPSDRRNMLRKLFHHLETLK